ncbi:hypothetical protein LXL04_009018 [Taraxacum kok-saghyz]
MGRRKLEIKRIQNKSSRLVAFSKRRSGLFKKARHLSVLCDVDVAAVVISDSGKVYEFSSGDTNSLTIYFSYFNVGLILSRHPNSWLQPEEQTTQEEACKNMGLFSNLCTRFRTCKQLLESVKRVDEEPDEVSLTDMADLEQELTHALMHTRSRKTQLMMERISSFREQERILTEKNEQLKHQKYEVHDGGGDFANNHNNYQSSNTNQLLTLPLFKE